LAFLGRTYCGAGEEYRAKDAKDAKVKGVEDDEIGGVVEEWAFALDKELGKELDDKGMDQSAF